MFESSEQGCSIKVVTNHSIGTCSVDLYILYLFETSGTASCGTTGILGYLVYKCHWVMKKCLTTSDQIKIEKSSDSWGFIRSSLTFW